MAVPPTRRMSAAERSTPELAIFIHCGTSPVMDRHGESVAAPAPDNTRPRPSPGPQLRDPSVYSRPWRCCREAGEAQPQSEPRKRGSSARVSSAISYGAGPQWLWLRSGRGAVRCDAVLPVRAPLAIMSGQQSCGHRLIRGRGQFLRTSVG